MWIPRLFGRRVSSRRYLDAHIVGAVIWSGFLVAEFGVREGPYGLWPLLSLAMLVGAAAVYVAFDHSFTVWLATLAAFPCALGVYFASSDRSGGVGPPFILGLVYGAAILAIWTLGSWLLSFLIGRCHSSHAKSPPRADNP